MTAMKLDAKLIMTLRVNCPERLAVGVNDFGFLRVIQISGGTFEGESLQGRVVPGGADWNMGFGGEDENSTASIEVFAKYLLQTDDGVYIAIENIGYKKKAQDPQPFIMTTPSFHAPRGKYEWLNYGVYVGSLKGSVINGINGVDIEIYQMQ
jgi:hypothetical protein